MGRAWAQRHTHIGLVRAHTSLSSASSAWGWLIPATPFREHRWLIPALQRAKHTFCSLYVWSLHRVAQAKKWAKNGREAGRHVRRQAGRQGGSGPKRQSATQCLRSKNLLNFSYLGNKNKNKDQVPHISMPYKITVCCAFAFGHIGQHQIMNNNLRSSRAAILDLQTNFNLEQSRSALSFLWGVSMETMIFTSLLREPMRKAKTTCEKNMPQHVCFRVF